MPLNVIIVRGCTKGVGSAWTSSRQSARFLVPRTTSTARRAPLLGSTLAKMWKAGLDLSAPLPFAAGFADADAATATAAAAAAVAAAAAAAAAAASEEVASRGEDDEDDEEGPEASPSD